MKQRIKLSESSLHRIIKESVRRILREEIEGNIPVDDRMIPYRQYDKKRAEEKASWDAFDKHNEGELYMGKPSHSNGYWEEYEKPEIERAMYQTMGNASQYSTYGEPQSHIRRNSGRYDRTPKRGEYMDGRMAIASLGDDDNEYDYLSGTSGKNHGTTSPSFARNPKNFTNGNRQKVGDVLSNWAMRDAEDVWNSERPLRDIGA